MLAQPCRTSGILADVYRNPGARRSDLTADDAGHRHRPCQATYNRNTKDKPIDGIFATSGVTVKGAGYYDFELLVTN